MLSIRMNTASSDSLLEVENLRMHFPVKGGVFLRAVDTCKAVDGITLNVRAGETLGLVGESGCGKSTLGKCIVRLLDPTSGTIRFAHADGAAVAGESSLRWTDITHLHRTEMLPLRRDMQMIFQDPAESLNPRMNVGSILEEPFVIHGIGTPEERQAKIRDLLDKVGLDTQMVHRFPFEFSGGQRQRIGIARAIALEPRLVVCDEPVSALDVSVQSQVLNLMLDLQQEFHLSYLFIAHDLSVVRHVSDRVAVMYLGKIMELADADSIYQNPQHAYTKALIAAIPVPDPTVKRAHEPLSGDVPSPIHPPEGCAFGHRVQHPKYPESVGTALPFKEVSPGHWVQACPCCTEHFEA